MYAHHLAGKIFIRNTYKAFPESSKEAAPFPGPIIVDKSLLPRRVFSGPPTRERSSPPLSFENVRHSDPTSITLSPTTFKIEDSNDTVKITIKIILKFRTYQTAHGTYHITSMIILNQMGIRV